MGRAFGFIGLLIALAVGAYLYSKQAQSLPGGAAPQTTIDLTGVRMDLLGIANAEKRHFATEGRYVSLDDLRTAGDIHLATNGRGPYSYTLDIGADEAFRVTATYSGPDTNAPRTLSVDQTMQVTTQ